MAIINLCKATDAGATGHHYQAGYSLWNGSEYVYAPGPMAYWTRLSHIGLCIRDYERNGYHDSDFHMIVWNAERNEPEDICFASTRGWSYPCYGSAPDATLEVMERYRLYQLGMSYLHEMQRRNAKALKLRDTRAMIKTAAEKHGIDFIAFMRAYRGWNAEQQEKIVKLLTANIRSGFKVSMRNQVIAWINSTERKFATPLSAKQMQYL
jgi:hypothetical protein